jgi:hypothetical protein
VLSVAGAPAPPPPPPQAGQSQFTLLSPTSGTKHVALGFPCRQGQFTGDIVASVGTLQVNVRNRWPDASAKFLQVAGSYASTGGVASTITLAAGTASGGAPLTIADLKATGVTAGIDCGSFGAVTWATTDWDTPFRIDPAGATVQPWVSGPQMSSWIYRKPVGADAHLVAWLEVRVYAGGAVEILPWVENGYLLVSGPTNKSATFQFTLGGTARLGAGLAIDLKSHQRTPLLSGSALSHWLGTDPDVAVVHDTSYLQSTELVPTYHARMDAGDAAVTGLYSTFTPLAAGDFDYDSDYMPGPGYQPPIGMLPNHDAIHLCADEVDRPATYRAVVRNGYAAGRYGLHFRDETTNRPPLFSAHQTLVIGNSQGFYNNGASTNNNVTPAITGGSPPAWDTAHAPTVGLLAYLVTGRWYHMETVQFAATTNHLGVTDWARANGTGGVNAPGYNGGSGIITAFLQTRAAAWWFRSVAQALCVTPDNDTALRGQFAASIQNTIDVHHAQYVAQTNNPYGWIRPGVYYSGTPGVTFEAPWQQDFVTAAWGWGLAMDLPISSGAKTKFQALFAWKAKSVIGRLGANNGTDWWHINAVIYTVAVAPSDTPDFVNGTGPWYPTWRAAYDATLARYPGDTSIGATEGMLASDILPGANAYWGNLQPAIAYAVRHGVAGAQEAFDRMTQSANWPELVSQFRSIPVWGVMPARANPTWLGNPAINQVVNVPGGQTPGGAGTLAFSNIANRDTLVVLAATGGHGDASDNGVRSINLRDNTPAWAPRRAPFGAPAQDVAYYRTTPTIEPTSRHTYDRTYYNPVVRKLVLHGTRAAYGSAQTFGASNALDLETWEWSPLGTIVDGSAQVQDTAGRAYGINGYFGVNEYVPVANTRAFLDNFSNELTRPMAFDTRRKTFYQLSYGNGDGAAGPGVDVRSYRYGERFGAGTQTAITFNAGAGLTALQADQVLDTTLVYVPAVDRFFYWTGNNLYRIKPNSGTVWDIEVVTLTGATIPPRGSDSSARMAYVPSLGGLAILHFSGPGIQFVKVH